MGLFDDLMGIAREVNDIKQEITDTVGQTVQSITDIKDEAADTAAQTGQSVTEAKDKLIGDIKGSSDAN